ncbi:hypothetical protein N7457_003927 [Penicillium paradoxum]|uniref:uncharacterized protein n=1 Tax=Penicillium paradoxum TaxID=176176 RepID=UPI0025470011|nr:uncharacterized protein N7457_003927 [Penicillium paradoxum]KAJ5782153.1 hypothetical protein N7457_003927 [Penicillium paradoxum]
MNTSRNTPSLLDLAKATNEVLSVDSDSASDADSDLDFGAMDSLDLSDNEDLMVIAIDFGTTYSGVAWATLYDFKRKNINLITEWPECPQEEGKVPTELFYEYGDKHWGYGIPGDADPIGWFKLLLLKDEDVPEHIRSSDFFLRAKRKVRDEGLTAQDMVADYLKLLWDHALEMILKSRGEHVVNNFRFHIVITVPAIWKGYARQSMQEAAEKAGLLVERDAGKTRLTFVPEPEAAALATLAEEENDAKPGDVYLICDAGGGTVDLISYKISEINPITLDEAVEGTGGLCGGIFIDNGFERIVKARLGRRWEQISQNGIKEILRGEWERGIKRAYKPQNAEKEYAISIPAEAFAQTGLDDTSREPHIKKGRIHFKGFHLQEAFAEAFAGIDKLVDEQLTKAKSKDLKIKSIVLVGGLGSSPYLYQHMKDRHAAAGVTVLQAGGMKPRTAICRGAIYRGFLDAESLSNEGNDGNEQGMKGLNVKSPISVASTISRMSLGTTSYHKYDPLKHSTDELEWLSDEGEYVATKQMEWEITCPKPSRSDPPRRLDETVQELCSVKCTCKIPLDSPLLKDHTSADKRKTTKKLDYVLEMVPSGAAMEFNFYIADQKQGSQNVDIEYQ